MFYFLGLKFGKPTPPAPAPTPTPEPKPIPTPAPPVDPYAEELKQLDEEARELSQRLTVALRHQRNARMRTRIEPLEEQAGIAPKKATTS